jgi:transposase
VFLPVLCRRWQGKRTVSTMKLAAQMITVIAARIPGRHLHVVADAAYHGKSLRDLPATATWTTRLPRRAVLYHRATGEGRQDRHPAQAAATAVCRTVSLARYGRSDTVSARCSVRTPMITNEASPALSVSIKAHHAT